MKKTTKKNNKSSKKKLLIIIISAFLAIAVIAGSVAAIVRNKNAVVHYEGVTMNDGVANFFVSYYKSTFLTALKNSGTDAYDTEEFWNSEYYSGTTYGAYFSVYAERYLTEIVASNYLFDKYSSLTSADKDKIDATVKEVLTYKANGSKDSFNEIAKDYGFDFSDFKTATKMLYKAQNMRKVVFGTEGEKMVQFEDECEDYLENYSHVKLLFIRTQTKFMLDADGNRVQGDDGNDTLIPLNEEEKAERAQLINKIRDAIKGKENNADVQMTEEMFNSYLEKNGEGDKDMNASGYYFFSEAEYTEQFGTRFPDIVATATSMDMYGYAEVATDFGVCFIYKYANTAGAYKNPSPDGCFSDFYSNAAEFLFARSIEETITDVEVNKDKIAEIDFAKIKSNSVYVPRF